MESTDFPSKATILQYFDELKKATDHDSMNAKSTLIDAHLSLLDQLVESIGSAWKSLKKAQTKREATAKKKKLESEKQDRMLHCLCVVELVSLFLLRFVFAYLQRSC